MSSLTTFVELAGIFSEFSAVSAGISSVAGKRASYCSGRHRYPAPRVELFGIMGSPSDGDNGGRMGCTQKKAGRSVIMASG